MSRKKMTGTLTIRLTSELRRKLSAKSKAEGKTPSAVARATLEAALGTEKPKTLAERMRKYIGVIKSRDVPNGRDARRALEEWSPDRRD
jgi:predicted DNA-binding protein